MYSSNSPLLSGTGCTVAEIPTKATAMAMRNKYGHRDTVMADTDRRPKKIMAE